MQFAFDLQEVSERWNQLYAFSEQNYESKVSDTQQSLKESDLDYIWPLVHKDPSKYIQTRPDLRDLLQKLRQSGKNVFLSTNSHLNWTNIILSKSIGKDWQSLFDICLLDCAKPLFYTTETLFRSSSCQTDKITTFEAFKDLTSKQKVFYGGNASTLVEYFKHSLHMNSPRILHISSQYLQDIHAAPFLVEQGVKWDSIAVISELSLYAGTQGYDKNYLIHDDQFWGLSYFFDQLYGLSADKTQRVLVGECKNFFIDQLAKVSRYAIGEVSQLTKMLERGTGMQKIEKKSEIESSVEESECEQNIDAASLKDFEQLKQQQSKKSPYIVSTREDGTLQMDPKGTHLFTFVWLHGKNEKNTYYQSVFEDEEHFKLPDGVRILIPKAPERSLKEEGTKVRTWYTTQKEGIDKDKDWQAESKECFNLADIMDSVKTISEIIVQEIDLLGSSKKIYLGGFAEGGSIALQTYMMFNRGILGGLVCCSGSFLGHVDWTVTEVKAKKETPLFFYHGQEDQVVPMQFAQNSYDYLLENGVNHFCFATEPQLDHELSDNAIRLIADFFRKHMIAPELTRFKQIMLESKKQRKRQFFKRRNDIPDTVELYGNLYVQVLTGDIVSDEVDAIVCPTNTNLSHGDGLSGKIQLAGGPEFQMKSNEYIKKHGKVPTSHCITTKATGDLKSKEIIHSIQPKMNQSSEDLYDLMHESIEMLEKTIMNVIQMANDKIKCRSLSIPAIPNSSKDSKFPMHIIVRTFFDAIQEHACMRSDNKDDSLQLIRLINADESITQMFRDELDQRFSQQQLLSDQESEKVLSDLEGEQELVLAEPEENQTELKDPLQSLQPLLYRGGFREKPDTNNNYARLYGHNLDPFAARCRYIMAFCNIEFQSIEMNLDEKADWHMQVNQGKIPILETPETMFINSTEIISFVLQNVGEKALDLLPKNTDSFQNSSMFEQLETFDGLLKPLLSLYSSRGQDFSLTERFVKEELEKHEDLAQRSVVDGDQKFLQGTEDITLVDIHIAPFWELLFMFQHGFLKTIWDKLDLKTNAPTVLSYIKKFRKHDLIQKHRMSQQVFINRCQRELWQITDNKAKLKDIICPLGFEFQGVIDDDTDLEPQKKTKKKNLFDKQKPMLITQEKLEADALKRQSLELLEQADPSRQKIMELINDDPVVVFGTPAAAKKTKDVREMFEKQKVFPVMNYLDKTNQGKAMHDALVKMSDKRGQPNLFIFIGGKHLGGKVDMKVAAENGSLQQMLDSAGVCHGF